MNRRMLPAIFCAVAVLCSIPAAHAEVLVYEGFHPEDYSNVAADKNVQANGHTATGNHTIGVSTASWSGMGGTMVRVFGANFGLALPSEMTTAGFSAVGGAVGLNPSQNNAEFRAMRHPLADNKTLAAGAGTNLYVRMLLNLDSTAAEMLAAGDKLENKKGGYFGAGFVNYGASGNQYNLLRRSDCKASFSFVIWKNSDDVYVLSLTLTDSSGNITDYPLVSGIVLGETYICYAEIQVGAGADGKEIIRAGAMAKSSFSAAAPWATIGDNSDSVMVQLITDSIYPTSMAVAGPYGTNGGRFLADEFVVGTEKKDILPVGGVFAVSATGMPTIEQTSFSTDWILVADDGVTADAGIVYSTDETFVTATTNPLGTGLSAGTRTATLSNLDPATTYWWKIYADNGTEVVETMSYSFRTIGAPILGDATATVTEQSAAYSVALAEAALENTLATPVSVFYGTDGETWTELPLGSASEAETFSGSVNNLGYGVTYQWFARASATMEGGRVLSTDSVTNSFTTPYNGDMYVDAAAENATPPYSTPATAAKTIAAALALAADGATIHVASGLYKISTPLNVTSAVRIIGDDPDPSHTIVSNTVEAGYSESGGKSNKRVFMLSNADAIVANMTFQNGSSWGRNSSGCGFAIGTSGGMVSNCVVEACMTKGNQAMAGGAQLEGGCVTHTVFRKCKVGSDTTSNKNQGMSYEPGVLRLTKYSKAENCLFVDNTQDKSKALTLIRLEDNATLRNCTIVDSGLGNTNQYCAVFTPIYLTSANATVQNVIVAGVTNRIDGALCRPAWGRPANFLNGATDADISGLNFPEGTVVGTASSFFKDYANGDYTPKAGGPLVGKGANYEGMASVDLAGNPRKVGSRIDIGCYEARSSALVIIVR